MSIRLFDRLLPYVVLAVLGEISIQLLKEISDSCAGLTLLSALLWICLLFIAHHALLRPRQRPPLQWIRQFFGFCLRVLGLGIVALIIALSLFVVLLEVTTLGDGLWGYRYLFEVDLGVSLAAGFLVVLTLFGTSLPAHIAERGRGLDAAVSRGANQFFWTWSRLTLGPILLFAITEMLIFTGADALSPSAWVLTESGFPNFPVIALLSIACLLQALGTVMLAWVLSSAFLRAEGAA